MPKAHDPLPDSVSADDIRKNVLNGGGFTVSVPETRSLDQMLSLAPVSATVYREMCWTIIKNVSDKSFLTSDNPVVKRDPKHNRGFYGVGLYNPTIEILFPLSPTIALLLTHDHERQKKYLELLKNDGKERASKFRSETLPETRFREGGERICSMIRGLVIEYAERWVFSPEKDDSIPEQFHGDPKGMRLHLG